MIGGLLVGAALMVAAPSDPDAPKPASYELEWSAPESCPAAESIRERIAELVPSPEGGDGVMYVNAVVEPTPDGFALALETEFLGSRSSRRVEAQRCDDLGESTALVVAIALQPGLEAEAVVPEPQPAPAPDARVEEPTAPPEVATTPSRETIRWQPRERGLPTDVLLRIGLLAEYGSLPQIGGGNALAFGILWPRLRIEIVGAYLWPRRFDHDAGDGLYQLGSVGARACLRVFAKPTEFPLCAGVDAGMLRADSRGLTPPGRIEDAWVAPMASAGVALRRNRVGFWSAAELGITARGTEVKVGDTRVWRTSPVSLRFVAGLEIFFATRRD